MEGVFTNPPASLPRAAADLTSEFSDDVESEIVSHLEGYGKIKSGKAKWRGKGRSGMGGIELL